MQPTYSIRSATATDEPFLIEMLYQALFVPPGEPPFPRDIVDRPELARYARGFGSQSTDIGFVADTPAGPIGASWVRQLTAADPGYGFIDGNTPELSIAVLPDHRSRGVGTALMSALITAVPRCSLSVDERNPAVSLYEQFGFVLVATDGPSLTMLRPG